MIAEFLGVLLPFVVAALLFAQSRKTLPLRAQAFRVGSAGIALLGFARLAAFLALPPMLASVLTGLGLAGMAVCAVLLLRSWRKGELAQEVERFRREAEAERERLRRK